MFEKIYSEALRTSTIQELKTLLSDLHLDVRETNPPFHTPASKLAAEGNHHAVEMLRQLGASSNNIARGYAIAGDHEKVEEYRTKFHAKEAIIAQGYAFKANNEKVEECRTKYNAEVSVIALSYAMAGNHDMVEWYRTKYNADVSYIAAGYALANNHDKVEFYKKNYQPLPELIAWGYALIGNSAMVKANISIANFKTHLDLFAMVYASSGQHTKMEELRIQYALSPDIIACSYADAGNHSKVIEYQNQHFASVLSIIYGYITGSYYDKVEEYRRTYNVDYIDIAKGYKSQPQPPSYTPPFYQAIIKLNNYHGTGQLNIGLSILGAMSRLKKGEESWNPYWINSGRKLDSIIKAVINLPADAKLELLVNDSNSEIYKALNMQRITPITFFGQLGYNHSKSLAAVQQDNSDFLGYK